MAWEFKREESKQFKEIPEGFHRVRIKKAEMAVSKKGNDMLVITLEISGYSSNLWNYITFMEDKPEITNRLLTQFFDSFGIEDGNFNLATYIGKVGGAKIVHDDDDIARIGYFVNKKKQEELPPWKGTDSDNGTGFKDIEDDEDLPFI